MPTLSPKRPRGRASVDRRPSTSSSSSHTRSVPARARRGRDAGGGAAPLTEDDVVPLSAELMAGAACVPGTGLEFDGVDDHAEIAPVEIGDQSTFAVWVRVDSFAQGDIQSIFDFGVFSTYENIHLLVNSYELLMWYISGNRDEDVIDQPDRFIIDRGNARHHLAFGFGIHRCMGNRLAEMQLRIVWEEIMKRFEQVEVVGAPKRLRSSFFRGITDLPVRVHPHS